MRLSSTSPGNSPRRPNLPSRGTWTGKDSSHAGVFLATSWLSEPAAGYSCALAQPHHHEAEDEDAHPATGNMSCGSSGALVVSLALQLTGMIPLSKANEQATEC